MENPRDSKSLWDGLLTFLSVVLMVAAVIDIALSPNDSAIMFAARFWQGVGIVFRSVAYRSGKIALNAEAAYWHAIEKVRQ